MLKIDELDPVLRPVAHNRRHGVAYGPVPDGYRREGDKLVKDALQQAELTVMRTMHEDGHSYNGIADFMNGGNMLTSRGRRWYPSSVRAVLMSKMATETAQCLR